MSVRRTWLRRVGLFTAGALATTTPVIMADVTSDEYADSLMRTVAASAAWSDLLDGQTAPQAPTLEASESAIVVLDGAALAAHPAADRAQAATTIAAEHAAFEKALAAVGGTVNFRYRALVNGLGVRVPTGRLARVAAIPGVRLVVPVTYLAPAAGAETLPGGGVALPGAPGAGATTPSQTPTTPAPAAPAAGQRAPETIALIDAGIQPEHPWLGGAIGPDRLIIGGADLVHGTPTPSAAPGARVAEAHGTEMAALVLNSPLFASLPAEKVPRMRAYRVTARELVSGRVRLLARSDRVLEAMERAVDPDANGDLSDRSSVILIGVARAYSSGAADPLAQAAAAADALGAVVVAPAGNSGPAAREWLGTIGGPAASEHVLTVGGLAAATTPRTATLALHVGPTTAELTKLPLLGPAPPPGALRTVVLAGSDGVVTGTQARDYADARGRSRVRGALVVVGRGGGTLQQKARAAAQAGAVALAVWDQDGGARFPGIRGDGELALPIVGLGRDQGRLMMDRAALSVTVTADEVRPAAPAVASFSARGPGPDGAVEPDLIAPAVDVETAYPGEGAELLTARISGTSAAAAQVAAMALRLRVERPDLSPSAVRSLMIQAARPIVGVSATDQGAGVAGPASLGPYAIDPGIIGGRRARTGVTTVTVTLRELAGATRTVQWAVTDATGAVVVAPGEPFTVDAGGAVRGRVAIPGGEGAFAGFLNVVAADRTVLARAPILLTPTPVATAGVSVPVVRATGDVAEARIAVSGSAGRAASVHALELSLLPAGAGKGPVIPLTSPRVAREWPAGSYRFLITAADATGTDIPAGRYRLRVRARGADGGRLARTSRPFTLD